MCAMVRKLSLQNQTAECPSQMVFVKVLNFFFICNVRCLPPAAATTTKRKKINKQIYKNNDINQIVRSQINGKPEPNIQEFMNLFGCSLLL